MLDSSRKSAESLVNLFVGLTELILAIRVIFRIFAAHDSVSFVHWIYSTSAVLMTPFRNIFTNPSVVEPKYILDMNALFAMAIYAAAGYLLISWMAGHRK